MNNPSVSQHLYPHQNDLEWSRSEKAIAHKAFDAALEREIQEVIREAKQKAGQIFWFLIPEAGAVKVLHAEWPTVQILSGNLLLTILRWRDETTVSVAPRHSPTQSYQLGPMDDAARLLRARLEDFNTAFSEEEFSRVGADFRLRDLVHRQ